MFRKFEDGTCQLDDQHVVLAPIAVDQTATEDDTDEVLRIERIPAQDAHVFRMVLAPAIHDSILRAAPVKPLCSKLAMQWTTVCPAARLFSLRENVPSAR